LFVVGVYLELFSQVCKSLIALYKVLFNPLDCISIDVCHLFIAYLLDDSWVLLLQDVLFHGLLVEHSFELSPLADVLLMIISL